MANAGRHSKHDPNRVAQIAIKYGSDAASERFGLSKKQITDIVARQRLNDPTLPKDRRLDPVHRRR